MQKFIAIAVLAMAAVAYAGSLGESMSEAAPEIDNNAEVASLGDKQVYADFCTKSRDYVYNSVKTLTNNQASSIFNLIFKNVEQLATSTLEKQTENAKLVANQIANPDAEIPEGLDATVSDGLNKIHGGQIQPASFYEGFMTIIKSTGSGVYAAIEAKYNELKMKAQPSLITLAVTNTCSQVSAMNAQIRSDFEQYNADTGNSATFMDVKCLTAQRIDMFDRICQLGKVSVGPLVKIYTRSD